MQNLKQLVTEFSDLATKLAAKLSEENEAKTAVDTASKYITFEQAATYLGLTKNQLYKLVNTREIAYYKPKARRLYFLISDLEEFQSRGRQKSRYEIETEQAATLKH